MKKLVTMSPRIPAGATGGFDPETGTPLPPPPAPPAITAETFDFGPAELELPTPRRTGTPREFWALFTADEQAAIVAAKAQSPAIDRWVFEALMGTFSLDHPSVALGMEALELAGVLTGARVAEIIGADFDNVGQGTE